MVNMPRCFISIIITQFRMVLRLLLHKQPQVYFRGEELYIYILFINTNVLPRITFICKFSVLEDSGDLHKVINF